MSLHRNNSGIECTKELLKHLTLWRLAAFGDFQKKKRLTHVALCRNFSGLVCSTDPVKVSKDMVNLLVCTRKNFLLAGFGFFMSDVISGGLLGHLGPLYLALSANR